MYAAVHYSHAKGRTMVNRAAFRVRAFAGMDFLHMDFILPYVLGCCSSLYIHYTEHKGGWQQNYLREGGGQGT